MKPGDSTNGDIATVPSYIRISTIQEQVRRAKSQINDFDYPAVEEDKIEGR